MKALFTFCIHSLCFNIYYHSTYKRFLKQQTQLHEDQKREMQNTVHYQNMLCIFIKKVNITRRTWP